MPVPNFEERITGHPGGCPALDYFDFEGLEATDDSVGVHVDVAGGQARRFAGLPVGHKEWTRLDWLGFSSMAGGKTVYYLDNVELDNRKR